MAGDRFSDVKADYWAALHVEALGRAGLRFKGCRAGRFCPGRIPTRAQVAQLIHDAYLLAEPAACHSGRDQSMGAPPSFSR